MANRKIKPHKKGRFSDLHCRIRIDLHEQLRHICSQRSVETGKRITMADWLESHIEADFALINNKQAADYRK